jgi:hypothetical protein
MVNKLKDLLGSRKFWAGLIGTVLVFINGQLKWLDEVQMGYVVAMISSWIVGQAIVDKAAK